MVKNTPFPGEKVILWSFSSKSSKSSREIPIPFRFRVTFQPFSGLGRVWLPWSQEAAAIPCLWDQQRSLGQGALIPPCCKVQGSKHLFWIFCSKKWSYPQETHHFQGIPTIWISSFVRSMLSYQGTSPFQQVIYASVVVQHRLMSYASSSALWKGMAAPIGMINCGIKKMKFLAKFGSFQHPWNIFVPIPNCMIEPNISRYWKYCSIVWSSFVWNTVVCRISNNFNWDSPVFFLQNFGWLGVCLFDPISGTCNLGKGWHEPICLDREWCSCGEDGEDNKVKKFWGPPKHPTLYQATDDHNLWKKSGSHGMYKTLVNNVSLKPATSTG